MTDIIDFISDLTFDTIPKEAIDSAKLCLLDATGCMVAGMTHPPIFELAQTICKNNPGLSGITGTCLKSTKPWVSFIHTHACTFFDLDDGNRKAQGHPGGVIIPLAMMTAAEQKCTGKELMVAIVAGYETAVRSALVMRQAGGPRKGSGAWSITGAVAAIGKILNLSKPSLKNALGLAEYYAPQAPQDKSLASPSSMKEGMAWAAYAAQTIIDLVLSGFDAMDPFLLDTDFCNDLGTDWETSRIYHKMYACCRFSHPVLDALESLMQKHGIHLDNIASIKVHSFNKTLLLDRTDPKNLVAAMYSIPWAIGCKLAKGAVGQEEMNDQVLTDKQIQSIAAKVIMEEDIGMTELFPGKCLAKVRLLLKSGIEIESDTLSARGDPDNPYSQKEMRAKFLNLTKSFTGKRNEKLYDLIMNIENEPAENIWGMLFFKGAY